MNEETPNQPEQPEQEQTPSPLSPASPLEVTALNAALAGKADADALEAVRGSLDALGAEVGSGGKNARVQYGQYWGTGTYGANNPNTLSFDFVPALLIISRDNNMPLIMVRGSLGMTLGGGNSATAITWSGRSVSWYHTNGTAPQFNMPSQLYYYYCFGYEE